jgi:pimeloyl-ACP methyl ester carboxylesterase
MDTRGHGESDRSPDGDYELSALAGDMLSVIDQLARPTIVVGASMGGLTGLLATPAAGPAKVTALVLVDVVPAYEKDGSARIRNFMQSGLHGFATLDEAAEAIAGYLPHRPKARSHEGLKRNLRLGDDGRWYWHWDPAFMQQKPLRDPSGRLAELEEAAARITVPVLLIRGRLSDVVSEEGVERFCKIVPQTQLVTLENAAHTAAGDDNEAFAAAVIDFVRALRA